MIDRTNAGLDIQVPQVKGQIRLRSAGAHKKPHYLGSVRFFKHLIVGFILVMMTVPWFAVIGVYSRGKAQSAAIESGLTAELNRVTGQYESLLVRYETEQAKLEEQVDHFAEQIRQMQMLYAYESSYGHLHPELRVTGPAEYIDSAKTVYLTFDDGPGVNTRAILNILSRYDIKATFFIVGRNAEGREELLKQVAEGGHTVGVHTYSHVYKDVYSSVEGFLDDFAACSAKIEEVTGIKPDIFRFPGGSVNSFNEGWGNTIMSEMLSRGYRFYDWNAGSSDVAAGATADTIYEAVLRQVHGNSYAVALFHDGGGSMARTVEALPRIIEQLLSEGYRFDRLTNQVKPTVFSIGNYSRG